MKSLQRINQIYEFNREWYGQNPQRGNVGLQGKFSWREKGECRVVVFFTEHFHKVEKELGQKLCGLVMS